MIEISLLLLAAFCVPVAISLSHCFVVSLISFNTLLIIYSLRIFLYKNSIDLSLFYFYFTFYCTAQKMKLPVKDFLIANLFTCPNDILNGKLNFLCRVYLITIMLWFLMSFTIIFHNFLYFFTQKER